MNKGPIAKNFVFTSYQLQPEKKRAVFGYAIEFENRPTLEFFETIIFPKKISLENIPTELLENVLQSVHLMLGISYFKLYCPPKIKLFKPICKKQAEFFNLVYRKGLGEFFFQNKIDPQGLIEFPHSSKVKIKNCSLKRKQRMLVGIGGGKDSIVAGELLKENGQKITALLVETQRSSSISDAVVKTMDIPALKVQRLLDKKIFEKFEGAYNGHVPISAVFAFVGYLTAILYDYSHVVVGNEFSSNFGNIKYKGESVNHQWSKSMEFEKLFQTYTKKLFSSDVVYFSLLRQFYEIRIAQMFTKQQKYFASFSSCNRNFKVHKERQENFWCGKCAKCVFVFTLLSAFLKKQELLKNFGKNLFEDKELLPVFEDVLGFGKMKPFDCVGTFAESQAALYLAQKNFGETFILKKLLPKIKNPEKLIKEVFKVNQVETLPENFRLLGLHNVLILGYGKEGKMTERYLKKYFPKLKIGIADESLAKNYLENQEKYDLAIKTPGIKKEKVLIPYITATNLFFSQNKNFTIGVTGSKGKSTTASLIATILKEAGKKVSLLGNIGHPMLGALMKKISPEEIFVLELSSYQLDDIAYSPNVVVALNLFPEHMDYHDGVENYYQAKKKIVSFQGSDDVFIYNANDNNLKNWIKDTAGQKKSFAGISIEGFHSSLLGRHNQDNIRAAVTVARHFGVSDAIIKKALKKFKPLEHRLEFVGEAKGVIFFDDAISTTPQSTMMALEAIRKVGTIFLGGEDRGYDFSQLEKQVRKKKIKNIVLFPDSGRKIFKSRKGLNILETNKMKEAVAFAFENTPKGSVCLLSNASPSYSLWKNFEEKGNQFKFWVKKLSKNKQNIK